MKMRLYLPILLGIALLVLSVGCGSVALDEGTAIPPASPSPAAGEPLEEALAPMAAASMTVRYVSGTAQAERKGEIIPLVEGALLYQGDALKTGGDGFVVLNAAGGKQLHIGADSALEISALAREGQTVLRIQEGNIVSIIDEELDEGANYEVETPSLIMAIRGTVASVSHDMALARSVVSLFEGEAIVHSREGVDVIAVAAGESAALVEGRLERKALLPDDLNANERMFLFDEEYSGIFAGDDIWDHTNQRLRGLLSRQEFDEAKRTYQAGDEEDAPHTSPLPTDESGIPVAGASGAVAGGGENNRDDDDDDGKGESTQANQRKAEVDSDEDMEPTPTPVAQKDDGSFSSIEQRFFDAKQAYESGRISKEEFLRIKDEYVAAKKRHYR